jgi:hypothetical protein
VIPVAGQAVATKLLPYFYAQYNWGENYLEAGKRSMARSDSAQAASKPSCRRPALLSNVCTAVLSLSAADVKSRGLKHMPGFSYYADAKALSRALLRYAEAGWSPLALFVGSIAIYLPMLLSDASHFNRRLAPTRNVVHQLLQPLRPSTQLRKASHATASSKHSWPTSLLAGQPQFLASPLPAPSLPPNGWLALLPRSCGWRGCSTMRSTLTR